MLRDVHKFGTGYFDKEYKGYSAIAGYIQRRYMAVPKDSDIKFNKGFIRKSVSLEKRIAYYKNSKQHYRIRFKRKTWLTLAFIIHRRSKSDENGNLDAFFLYSRTPTRA